MNEVMRLNDGAAKQRVVRNSMLNFPGCRACMVSTNNATLKSTEPE